jgi:YVTN family beta-propeller protein
VLAFALGALALPIGVTAAGAGSGPAQVFPVPKGEPFELAVGLGAVWFTDGLESRLVKMDSRTGKFLGEVPISNAAALAIGRDVVWVSGEEGIVAVDPKSVKITKRIPLSTGRISAIAASDDALWVTDDFEGTLTRIDPKTGEVVATIDLGDEPWDVVVDRNGVWVANLATDTVTLVDPATNAIDTVVSDQTLSAADLAAGAGGVWTEGSADSVCRVRTGEKPSCISLPGNAGDVAVFRGRVWVASDDGTVFKIDPRTKKVATIDTGGTSLDDIVGGLGAVFTGQRVAKNSAVLRLKP